MTEKAPSLDAIRAAGLRLSPYIKRTPIVAFQSRHLQSRVDCEFVAKLELFQHSGTFKARGAINSIMKLKEKARKVTAVSAGNHAVAVAYAASVLGSDAKVVMQDTANPYRIERAKSYGAEVVFAPPGQAAFDRVREIERTEGRAFIHPFEGYAVTEGTGGIGLEFMEQDPALDAVIVAVGGGGLASGVAAAVKQMNPNCLVFGVEPEGSAVMALSFAKGEPSVLDHMSTIADSLSPPMTTPYAFSICRQYIDELVTVSDDEIAAAAAVLFYDLKLAVEPAAAAALAGAMGPLSARLSGLRVGLIICGANIDSASFTSLLERGEAVLNGQ
ncbi:MAG: threonine/serine dehydratase [Emcibacter sp.]|nr:threonine/serine dehydratase [Emcibacter sp.]